MTPENKFAAQILELSADGFAGMACGVLFEADPAMAERYSSEGFSSWKAQLRQWLVDLSAAVAAGQPGLFQQRMEWVRQSFEARTAPVDDLRGGLSALKEVLRERLPEESVEVVLPVVDRALAAMSGPPATAGDADASEGQPDRRSLAYLKTVLEGDSRAAIEQVLASVDEGMSVQDAYVRILLPAQREAGRMWHAAELSIAEEHVVTVATQRAMALLCERARPSVAIGRTVVLACVAGNTHDIGLRAITDFFDMSGWRPVSLGGDTPPEEIARGVAFFDADLLVLAVTLETQINAAERTIQQVRALDGRRPRIIVGGAVFARAPELWQQLGADGCSSTVEGTEPLGRRLTD